MKLLILLISLFTLIGCEAPASGSFVLGEGDKKVEVVYNPSPQRDTSSGSSPVSGF